MLQTMLERSTAASLLSAREATHLRHQLAGRALSEIELDGLVSSGLERMLDSLVALGPNATAHAMGRERGTAAATAIGQTRLANIPEPEIVAGKYRLDSVIGRGGMGEVYRGKNIALDILIAIKLTHFDSERLSSYFVQEGRALGRLSHPNVVKVYDAGVHPGVSGSTMDRAFIVMELLEGVSLRAHLEQHGRLNFAAAAKIAHEMSAGLAAAHDLDLIHRDLKPENVMLTREGTKLIDFGLVIVDKMDAHQRNTGEGLIIGTPGYMSPEQINGHAVTPATDVYSVGVILLEMLLGRNPFQADNGMQSALNHLHMVPPMPSAEGIDVHSSIERMLASCLAKAPADRPQHAREIYSCLSSALQVTAW